MSFPASDERAEQIRRLFDEAADLGTDVRASYLGRECPNDDVRQEVEALLQAFEHGGGGVRNVLESVFFTAPSASRKAVHDLTGKNLSRYQIQEQLGRGGMGVVYKARDTKLGRSVALKFLPTHLNLNDEAKVRFMHEAKAASALDHPNICTVYDVDETDEGLLFIAMAYYSGETLKARIARGALPLEEALDYAIQMAEGLKAAHKEGIMHRDIKPSNVIVTEQARVRLVDFGIAKVQDVTLTRAGTALGTAAYMSPEQARGEVVDQRTDLWSLGVVLYEMITGERPFRGEPEQAAIYQVMNEDPAPMASLHGDLPPDLVAVVYKCLEKTRADRHRTASLLLTDLHRVRRRLLEGGAAARVSDMTPVANATPVADTTPGDAPSQLVGAPSPFATRRLQRARVSVSYMRGGEPDDEVAGAVYDALSTDHDVFIDTMLPAGARWIEQIEAELARSDYLIVLLSRRSIHSEMVLAEIQTAYRLSEEREGRPALLPVRLNYAHPFAYPLSAYLDDLNEAYWRGHADTPRLIEQLKRAVAGGDLSESWRVRTRPIEKQDPQSFPEPLAAAQPHLETPEGTMDPHSAFYVHRPQDDVAQQAIMQRGVTLTIKGPRQMGKSSLLVRTMSAAAKVGKQVVFLDFQLFNQSALNDADTFFKQFCVWLTFKLKLENRVEEYWQWPLGNSHCCTLYVEDCILGAIDRPLVLAMDEVERVFDTDFRSDFFGMLRSWHNDRATAQIWKRLDLALVTSTEPYQLIENLNQSPFNVGEVVEMKDFTPRQVEELNERHGSPCSTDEIDRVTALLGGHPYLTRKAFYLIAGGQMSTTDLLASATRDRGPFGDHLRYHLFRLHGHDDLKGGLREVIRRERCEDEGVFWRLQGAGLVLRDGPVVVPRCRLYAEYFRGHFDG